MGSHVCKEYQVDAWGQGWSSRKGEFLELCISRGGITEYGLKSLVRLHKLLEYQEDDRPTHAGLT